MPESPGDVQLVVTPPGPFGATLVRRMGARTTYGVLMEIVTQANSRLLISTPFHFHEPKHGHRGLGNGVKSGCGTIRPDRYREHLGIDCSPQSGDARLCSAPQGKLSSTQGRDYGLNVGFACEAVHRRRGLWLYRKRQPDCPWLDE